MIGKRLKELRERLNLTQAEFAKALKIKPKSFSRYELDMRYTFMIR